jgi:hypothetical protein
MAGVFRLAAQIITTNGHHQGDYIPDPFNRVLKALPSERPMSAVAALRCAETGDPGGYGPASTAAVKFLADRLLVNDELPFHTDAKSLEFHVAEWGDVLGRTPAEVVAELLRAAEAVELLAPQPSAPVVAMSLVLADKTRWELAGVGADGSAHYVLAGVPTGEQSFSYASADELTNRFGAVVSSGGAW